MSALSGAHDFVIREFIGHQTNFNLTNGQTGIDILLEASTPEAAVDAEERDYAPSCFPDTRVQYIEDITNWATASNGVHLPIYWMKGPAGVGKSAIAQTCAQKVKGSGQLGAAFFFSINGRQKDHTRFFPTLAYQLSTILDDYRENINLRILKDKTIVTKTMKAQFESLIVEPLRDLKEQGKEVRMRPIFIDGLDECESKDAQVDIIKIIASSVQAQSTPFCWAIFSRAEPHIVSAFRLPHISPHCRLVSLSISRDSDKEIEAYLRGGFENILRRRDMVLSSLWPTDEDIRKLIDAAAGLFAYCAIVLRFVDTYSSAGFKETLQAVLEVIAQPLFHPLPLFADLDRLYTLILQRVPGDILPSMLLFLRSITTSNFTDMSKIVAFSCNALGISETYLKTICHHLQAVMTYQEPVKPFQVLDPRVDLSRSYWEQDSSFDPDASLEAQMSLVHGTVSYLHKSFNDFLYDPDRSSIFCTHTEAMREAYIDRLAQQHLHFASSYIIQGSRLILAPGVTSSSTSLPWPQGTEFVDSVLKLRAFWITSFVTSDLLLVGSFARRLSPRVMQRLAELDHRKSSIAQRTYHGLGLQSNTPVLHTLGHVRRIDGTSFGCIQSEAYDKFDPADFLASVKALEDLGIIKAFHPRVPSALASMHNSYSRYKSGKQYGLYEFGRGEKSVVWYWEYDPKKRYYHEFRTTKYAEAMRIYKMEKLKIWEESWVVPS